MKTSDGQTSAVPSSTPPEEPEVLNAIFSNMRVIICDAQYRFHRINAILLNSRDLLDLVATHEDDSAMLDAQNLSFVLSDALAHLKVLYSQLGDLEGIAYDGNLDTAGERHLWHIFRHLWAITEPEQHRLIVKTMKTLEGRVRFRDELQTFLQELTAKQQSHEPPEGSGDA